MSHFVRLFQPRFAALVEAGRKWQTVRPEPKRMPKPGDTISLRCWTGAPYRSKQRIIREAEIRDVHHTLIDADGMNLYERDAAWAPDRDAFARADGFADWREMRAWFETEYDLPFRGIVLYWHNGEVSHAAKRPGCNSVFLAHSTLTADELLTLSREQWPEVWARPNFPLSNTQSMPRADCGTQAPSVEGAHEPRRG